MYSVEEHNRYIYKIADNYQNNAISSVILYVTQLLDSLERFIDISHCLKSMIVFQKNTKWVTISLYHPVEIKGIIDF